VLRKELILLSGLFDADWYRKFYPDVADSGLDPVTHYLRIGSRKKRHPSRWFDVDFYLSKYPSSQCFSANVGTL
jgi:O-antigen biosynthesis protein